MPNPFIPTAGTRLYSGALEADPAAEFAPDNIRSWDGLPGEDTEEFETTSDNQMDPDNPDEADLVPQNAGGYEDPGKLMFTIGGDEDDVEEAYTLKKSHEVKRWKVLFISGAYMLFDGWMMGVKPKPETKKDVTFALTIRVTGKVEFHKAA